MTSPSKNGTLVGHYAAKSPIANSSTNVVRMGQWYRVKSGTITYEGTTYNVGESFKAISLGASPTAESFNAGPNGVLEAIIKIKKYDAPLGAKYQETVIDNDFYDGKGMTADHFLKSYWRKEKQRFALSLTDTSGNITYARWLTDKEIPEQWKNSTDLDDLGNPIGFDMRIMPLNFGAPSIPDPLNPTPRYVLRHIGIELNGIDFSKLLSELNLNSYADLKKYYTGFAILRCPTDTKIIAQGSVYPCTKNQTYVPSGFSSTMKPMAARKMSQDNDGQLGASGQVANYYTFYSPDFQFRFNGNPSLASATEANIVGMYDYYGQDWYHRTQPLTDTIVAIDKNIAYSRGTFPYAVAGTNIPLNPNECAEEIDYAGAGAVGNTANWFDNANINGAAFMFGSSLGFSPSTVGCRTTVLSIPNIAPFPVPQGDLGRHVVNICNSKTSFYGGSSPAAKANNQYIPVNHYQAFDDEFLEMLNDTNGICNGIEVFGGDANLGLYTTLRATRKDGFYEYNHIVIFPLESHCNFSMRNGRFAPKNGADVFYSADPEVFNLNHAYANTHIISPYSALPNRFKSVNRYPYRGLFSLRKNPGEEIDGFRKFDLAAFRDVSGISGAITNFRAKSGKLFYFQKRAVGYIPINERQTVTSAVGSPTVIGQGGVMERYDERTNYFGNQHQFGLVDLPDGFIWIDVERKSLCSMSTGLEIIELDVAKGMNSFLQSNLKGDIFVNDRPTAGKGITGYYDPQYNRAVISILGTANDFTIMYDQLNTAFTGFVPFKAGIFHQFQNLILAMNPQHSYITPVNGMLIKAGTTVTDGVKSYVCKLDFYYASVPFATDIQHWDFLHSSEDVYLQNEGDICKWFGLVHPSKLVYYIQGEDLNVSKVFDNIEWRASKEFFDTLFAETTDQAAMDSDITNDRKNYEYRNKMWMGSLPVSLSGRLVDTKLQVTLLKQNQAGLPTISKNEQVVLFTSKCTFRDRK